LTAYYALFRVPFTVALIALSVYATVFGWRHWAGPSRRTPRDIFLLTADGPFAIHLVLGLVGLMIAMRFDMSDPHRVTRRAASGFWLHVIAAPAIVNTVALTLFDAGTAPAQMRWAFIALLAVIAVVIDRRSFLVSGVGYVVALAITVAEGQAFFIILMLGAGLVLLGAQWEVLRRAIMRALPSVPRQDPPAPLRPAAKGNPRVTDLTPREIVSELDRFIIGQKDAKRAVAVALRNRWRRKQLGDDLREEVYPKNILMIGPPASARPRSRGGWPSSPRRLSSRSRPRNIPRSAMSGATWNRSSAISWMPRRSWCARTCATRSRPRPMTPPRNG
jgi:hypothetical protein